ncbi:MAG: ATP-binding cassette domain-containing protein [Verrucomicrobia bacterium]|nr:ATP-binding cassette domain-containing protein [Verrucomicrobiota bacterium]
MPEDVIVVEQIRWQGVNECDFPVTPINYHFQPARFYLLTSEQPEPKDKLLRLVGLLEEPKSGEVLLEGRQVTGLDPEELAEIRNRKFGFLFSSPFLLPAFTVLENVAMPLFKIAQVDARQAKTTTELVLSLVGIMPLVDMPARQLSLLDQHLTALARAVVHYPRLLIVQDLGMNLTPDEASILVQATARIPGRLGTTVIATAAPEFDFAGWDVALEIDANGIKESQPER